MSISKNKFDHTIIFLVFNGIFIQEIVRKYVFGGVAPLAVYEIIVIAIGIIFAFKIPYKQIEKLYYACAFIGIWGLFTITLSSKGSILLFFLGWRPYLVGVAFCVLGVRLYVINSQTRTLKALLYVVVTWLVILTCLAALQIYVGPTHFITQGLNQGEHLGIGGWAGADEIFRAPSIFQHTGKYGQLTFLLCCASLAFRQAVGVSKKFNIILLAIEVSAILITGQRAGILGYTLLFILLNLRSSGSAVVLVATSIFTFFVFKIFSAALDNPFITRALSVFNEIGQRFYMNLIVPFGEAFNEYAMKGLGFGYLSFGSEMFGGSKLVDVLTVGNGENSFVRIVFEAGLVGLLLAVVFVIMPIWQAIIFKRRIYLLDKINQRGGKVIVIFVTFLFIYLGVWSITHDTLGASSTMGVAFFFSSIVWTGSLRRGSTRPLFLPVKAEPFEDKAQSLPSSAQRTVQARGSASSP